MNTRLHFSIIQRFARLGIANHSGLYFTPNNTGYRMYAFGAQAGPSQSTVNVFHELGHAAEFGGDHFRTRCIRGMFRFKVPEVNVLGRTCIEPVTTQMTLREIRTVAHQYHLMKLAGFKVNSQAYAEDQSNTLDFVPDYFLIGKLETRHALRAQMILERIESQSASESLDRLVGWLDATAKHLKRQKDFFKDMPDSKQIRGMDIFTGQGELVSV